jgi:Pyridine nucleotide-disulphide oxidoreductase, dimerisation domain
MQKGTWRPVVTRLPSPATDPELARIGLSETEAKQRGVPYRVAKLPMAAVLRAMTISETRGFMKVLVETEKSYRHSPLALWQGDEECITRGAPGFRAWVCSNQETETRPGAPPSGIQFPVLAGGGGGGGLEGRMVPV